MLWVEIVEEIKHEEVPGPFQEFFRLLDQALVIQDIILNEIEGNPRQGVISIL